MSILGSTGVPCFGDSCSTTAEYDSSTGVVIHTNLSSIGGIECDPAAGGLKIRLLNEDSKACIPAAVASEDCVELRITCDGELFVQLNVDQVDGALGCTTDGLGLRRVDTGYDMDSLSSTNVCKNLLSVSNNSNEAYVLPDVSYVSDSVGEGGRRRIFSTNGATSISSFDASVTNLGDCPRLYYFNVRLIVEVLAGNSPGDTWKLQGEVFLQSSRSFIGGGNKLGRTFAEFGHTVSPGGDIFISAQNHSQWMIIPSGATVNFTSGFQNGEAFGFNGNNGDGFGYQVLGFRYMAIDYLDRRI